MKKAFVSSILAITFSLGSTSQVNARILEGEGYGSTIERAQVAAVSALANSIYVNVESSSSVYQDNTGTDDFVFQAKLTTNLPVLGVKYLCKKSSQEHLCSALLDSKTALPLYKAELLNLVKYIDEKYTSLASMDQDVRLDTMYSLLAKLNQYEKLSFVARFLADHNSPLIKPSVDIRQVNARILELENSIKSLDVAARLIARKLHHEGVYITPVTLPDSREITPFASALADKVRVQIKSVNNRERADYILEGSYIGDKTGISVNYNLSDQQGNTVKSTVISLLPESYARYRTTPLAPDFDQLLHNGYALSSDFRASIATNKGLRNLLFHKGEEVELVMKMNSPGYFYLVGHTKNEGFEQSYLVELNEAPGDRRFIGFVNADDINKWISLGEFVVEEPFGLESIQLMASTNDPVGLLPSYKYASNSGYYVISYKIEQGVRMTRGLKKIKTAKTDSAESVLLFTTENK